MVATANGSGNPGRLVLVLGTAHSITRIPTENIALVKAISSDDYRVSILTSIKFAFAKYILVTRRFGALEDKYQLSNSTPSWIVTHEGRSESIICGQLNLAAGLCA